ncbi:MAG: SAM-dependent methyltransferase, partial [Planctomycetota bacterium]
QQVPIASNFLQLVSLYFTALANGSSRFYRSGDFHRLLKQADLVLVEEQDTLGLGHTLQRWKTSPAR